MELNASFWMIVVGVLLIVAVLLDGYRRMRSAQRDHLRINVKNEREDEDYNPELPGGGARVVKSGKNKSLEELDPLFDTIPEGDELEAARAESRREQTDEAADAEAPAEPDDAVLQDSPLTRDPEPVVTQRPLTASRDDEPDFSSSKPLSSRDEAPAKPEASSKAQDPQEIIVLHVMAGDDGFSGRDLLQVLLACDVRYGKMNIFHRYEQEGGAGESQFSIVNSVNPGTFDLDDVDAFSTPGVSFFMQLPGPADPMMAFDCMVETARTLVKNLGGSLQDETHSVATNQTLAHYRQRIRDFARKQLTLV